MGRSSSPGKGAILPEQYFVSNLMNDFFFFRRLFVEVQQLADKSEIKSDEYVIEVFVEPDNKVVSSK